MGLVSQLAARRDWLTGSYQSTPPSGGNYPITFPDTPLSIKAELLLGGVWVDITSYIYYEDKIRIERGRGNESSRATPSKCTIKLKNPNRIWSPRNPNGPYYGLLNRNVKLRISVNPGDGDHLRYTGYVSQWPQQWSTGNHRWVSLQANGILKRLNQGKGALRAPIYRAVSAAQPFAYWTLTDPSDASSAASEIVGGSPFVPVGDFDFAGFTAPDGLPAVAVKTGYAQATVTPILTTACTGWVLGFGMKLQSVDITERKPILRFTTDGFISDWTMYPPTADAAFRTQMDLSDTFGTTVTSCVMNPLWTAQDYADLFDNQWHYFQLVSWQIAGPLQRTAAYMDGELVGFGASLPLPVSSTGIGRPTIVEFNPELVDWTDLNLALSNLSFIETEDISTHGSAFSAYVGETPTARFARVCTEEGIEYTIGELIADDQPMGPQPVDTLMNILRECEAANEGVMDEDLQGRLRLLSRTLTWNQPPAMIIDYEAGPHGQVKEGFRPTDDDLLIRNDWTITRKNGGSRQYVQTSGPLNVNDPTDDPQGVLRYDDSATLNLYADDQAYQHATWRVARGTVDEMRIAEMPIHLSSTPELINEWLAMDINSGFKINNTPVDMGSIPSWQTMAGYIEIIDRLEWKASLFGVPASVDQMGTIEEYGYTDCYACFLDEDLDTTETSIAVYIEDTCVWVDIDLPFNVIFSGEEVTVTAVAAAVGSGSSWTQVLTVTRSVNGVVKEHLRGAQVDVAEPFILSL